MLEIRKLKKYFPVGKNIFISSKQIVKAVDDISIHIRKGETFGLVGESGCGKTTFGRTVLRLFEPTSGDIIFNGVNITKTDMRPLRKKMQIIFQDPYASLDPRMTAGDIIGEPMEIHNIREPKERREKVNDLLKMTGLSREYANRYPHELSGGQRQRIGIARALAIEPEFVVCDEPVSSLDVTIQAQIVNMLDGLKQSLGLTYLFITHNLSVVRHISDRIAVMYLGRIIELADTGELFKNPANPYTQALLLAIPVLVPQGNRNKKRMILEGEIPSPIDPPSGCRFRTRCPYAVKTCRETEPEFKEISPGHFCACHMIK